MDMLSKPIVVLFGYKLDKDKVVFVGRQGDIKLEITRHRNDLLRILALCNGRRLIERIRQKFNRISDKDFKGFIDLMEELGVIVDSRELYLGFHKDSANPMIFARKMSPQEANDLVGNRSLIPRSNTYIALHTNITEYLLQLCSERKSSRVFSGESLSLEHVSGLMRTMYTIGKHRSTPSAGQLYPLDIYIAVMIDSTDLAKGLYRYDPERLLLNHVEKVTVTQDIIARILNGHEAERASMVVFIAADLERSAAKYANRGYRFALIESGHAAQNAHLYCAEVKDIGMVEYGGFQDTLAAEFLSLNYPRQAVLLSLIVGHKNELGQPSRSYLNDAWNLHEQLVGENKPIEYIIVGYPTYGKYKLPRVEALAKYRQLPESKSQIPEVECFGSGLAVTSDEAQIKALAEAYERHVSGMLRIDVSSSALHLKVEWLNPRKVVPLQPLAFERHGWSDFSPKQEWQWTMGRRYSTGKEVLVPVDLVFYPLSHEQLGRRICYASTSSGVAAHTNYQVATEKALLELIERDAIAIVWYTERDVHAIPTNILPDDILLRMQHWIDKDWQIKFLDLTLDSVPVIMCVIYSFTRFPSFVAGAAANPDWNIAATKAWDEAEIFLLNWCRKRPKLPEPEDVFSPLQHGMLYFKPNNLRRVQWLLEAKEVMPRWGDTKSMADALLKFDPVLLNLAESGSVCGLNVVRAISVELLPINFGFGNEHLGHQRLMNLGLTWKREFPAFPHFFA